MTEQFNIKAGERADAFKCSHCGSGSYTGFVKDGIFYRSCGLCSGSTSVGTDISRMDGIEIEDRAIAGGADEHRVKKAGFGRYLEEINHVIKNAPNDADRAHYENVKRTQVLPWYNKYHGTNYTN